MSAEGYKPSKEEIKEGEDMMSETQRHESTVRARVHENIVYAPELPEAVITFKSRITRALEGLDGNINYLETKDTSIFNRKENPAGQKPIEDKERIEEVKRIQSEILQKLEELDKLFGADSAG